jgi:hypothetical protein
MAEPTNRPISFDLSEAHRTALETIAGGRKVDLREGNCDIRQ